MLLTTVRSQPTMRRFKSMLGEFIPDTVLRHVFSHLEANDKLLCSQVCKRWHRILMLARPWTEVNRVVFRNPLQTAALDNVCRLCPNLSTTILRRLDVTKEVSDLVNKLSQSCNKLDYIVFDRCRIIAMCEFMSAFLSKFATVDLLNSCVFGKCANSSCNVCHG
jgi:hypothetical protein